MSLPPEKQNEIIEKLIESIKRKKGEPSFKCPVCSNDNFVLADGVSNLPLNDKITGDIVIGGQILPNIPIVCNNCGYTSFHNIKVLGVSEETKEQKTNLKKNG